MVVRADKSAREGGLPLGLVGREMWASFSADDGARYLYIL